MPRKAKLDKYVSSFTDIRGKTRYRYRRKGFSTYLPAPTDRRYREAYEAANRGQRPNAPRRVKPETVGDMVTRFYASLAFHEAGETRKANLRSIIEPFHEKHRDIAVRHFEPDHIERILIDRATPKPDGTGGTGAAVNLYGELKRLFELTVAWGWRRSNPVRQVKKPRHKVKGYYTWTPANIRQYRKTHEIGTMPRAALEIMLWTLQRGGDAREFGPDNRQGGRIVWNANKTGDSQSIMEAPQLTAALKALPYSGDGPYLKTDYGRPFSKKGFGNKFRKWCDQAGLPQCTAHGCRKAMATIAAENLATHSQLKALGGWKGDEEVATYTRTANQARLADEALAMLIEQDANNG